MMVEEVILKVKMYILKKEKEVVIVIVEEVVFVVVVEKLDLDFRYDIDLLFLLVNVV